MYGEIRDLFQKMEGKIDSAFQDLNSKLMNFEERVTLLEQNSPSSSSLSTSISNENSLDGKRKKRSPSELQVWMSFTMCHVYNLYNSSFKLEVCIHHLGMKISFIVMKGL